MARRRRAPLALAALALIRSGWGAAHAGATPAQRSAAIAQTDNGDVPPEPAPSPSDPPSPPKQAPKGAGPAAPSKSSSSSGGTSSPSSPSGSSGGGGHGPDGAMTSTGSSAVALTFDDGPGEYTNTVLDLLAQHHIKATFCLIGKQVAEYAAQVRRIVADGHTLCNHTWSHDLNLRTRTNDQIRADLQRTNDTIHAVVPDAPIKYFRNPGGNWGTNTVGVAASMDMASIHWSVDPQDWRIPAPQATLNNVPSAGRPGAGPTTRPTLWSRPRRSSTSAPRAATGVPTPSASPPAWTWHRSTGASTRRTGGYPRLRRSSTTSEARVSASPAGRRS